MEQEAGVNTVVRIDGLWMTPGIEPAEAWVQGIGRGGLLCIQGCFWGLSASRSGGSVIAAFPSRCILPP